MADLGWSRAVFAKIGIRQSLEEAWFQLDQTLRLVSSFVCLEKLEQA